MKNGKRKWLCILLAAILLSTALINFDPKIKAEKFVGRWGKAIEEGIASGTGVPAGAGDFVGNDEMIQFTLSARGFGSQTSYYGVYYSYEDVPHTFQYGDWDLTEIREGVWEWQAEGDNHGLTEKIRDHWYYFEMYF